MTTPIISIHGISKKYRFGGMKGFFSYKTLRDTLTTAFTKPIRLFSKDSDPSSNPSYFWALKDVSFEVMPGEVIGLIGRNGAGKTTLLKIFSQITEPTEGEIRIRGRVASLLEVGTGFHPELSGRENIFMNGAILGMSRAETRSKFDEIVAFAEVDKFLDTPVKRYSSGMYVRLAFSVAAHLEPEILLVDEVLAVGDAAFQKKCLGKMQDVTRKEGRTVLFVSHNMAAINTLCTRSVLLQQGRLAKDGPTQEVTAFYQSNSLAAIAEKKDLADAPRSGNGKARFLWVDVKPAPQNGETPSAIISGNDVMVETEIECIEEISDTDIEIIIYDGNGYRLVDACSSFKEIFLNMKAGRKAIARLKLQTVLIKPGTYYVGLWLGKGHSWTTSPWWPREVMDHIEYAATMDVIDILEDRKYVDMPPGPYLCKYDMEIVTD